jgi:Tol biopolymer transport system component
MEVMMRSLPRVPRTPPAFLLLTAAAAVLLLLTACKDLVGPISEVEEQLLFLSTRDGATDGLGRPTKEIYSIAADGTGAEKLTGQPAWMYAHMGLSPDGRKLVFSRDGNVWVMNVDGTGLMRLTNQDGGHGDGSNAWPRWSRDGSRIAFASNRGGRSLGLHSGLYEVYVMNANGSDPRDVSHAVRDELSFNVGVAGWTPDGRVVFQTHDGLVDRRLYTVNADGTGAQRFLGTHGGHSPHWSPDGSRLVFIREQGGVRQLYIANADGTGAAPLSQLAGNHWLPGLNGGTMEQVDHSPWSPDGSRVAFMLDRLNEWGIYVVNADGSGMRRLTQDWVLFNGWSYRGDRIAFSALVSRPEGTASDVFVIKADGTGRRNVTDSPADDSNALWLPQ